MLSFASFSIQYGATNEIGNHNESSKNSIATSFVESKVTDYTQVR